MIIPISSIIILTCFVWALNKKLLRQRQICPLCAGVSLTWFWIFFGMFFGKLLVADYQLPIAILAGGTIVGLMSKLEEFIKVKFILIWKTIFVVSGFMAVYSLVNNQWGILAVGVILDILTTLIFKKYGAEKESLDSKKVKELKEKMKNCC